MTKTLQALRWAENKLNQLRGRKKSTRGQSFVEIALLFPVLLIILSGLVEYGFVLNQYLNLLDGAREAARFGSDGDPFQRQPANTNCSAALGPVTGDFYNQLACLAMQVARPLVFDPATDDVVISAFAVDNGRVVNRFPATPNDPPSPGVPSTETSGEWHMYGYGGQCDTDSSSCHPSRFSAAEIQTRLSGSAPNTGILLVEIYYDYDQILKLPWITAFVPDPMRLHVYSIMPLVAAEPDA